MLVDIQHPKLNRWKRVNQVIIYPHMVYHLHRRLHRCLIPYRQQYPTLISWIQWPWQRWSMIKRVVHHQPHPIHRIHPLLRLIFVVQIQSQHRVPFHLLLRLMQLHQETIPLHHHYMEIIKAIICILPTIFKMEITITITMVNIFIHRIMITVLLLSHQPMDIGHIQHNPISLVQRDSTWSPNHLHHVQSHHQECLTHLPLPRNKI